MTRIKLPETVGLSDKYLERKGDYWRLLDSEAKLIRALNIYETRIVEAAYRRRCEHHTADIERLEAMVADRDKGNAQLRSAANLLDQRAAMFEEAYKQERKAWGFPAFLGLLAGYLLAWLT